MRLPGIQALLLALGLTLAGAGALAGEADVIDTRVTLRGGGVFDFDVTIRSNDLGWDHYADAFEVLAPDGTLLGRRVLLHPHETEQPFTRSLGGVAIPAGVTSVTLRAHDKLHGFGGAEFTITLPER